VSSEATDDTTAAVIARLATVRQRIHDAACAAGRDPAQVHLLLAVKAMPTRVVRAAVNAGATLLGENRVQELAEHAPAIADLRPTIHLIGHLQSNKVAAALAWVSCVQSVDSIEIAERLSRACVRLGRDLDVMVQVNVSGERTKFGVAPDAAARLAVDVASLARLRLTGFMTIGANSPDVTLVRAGYARLRQAREEVVGTGMPGTAAATELSMGMSGDFEAAIAEGATIVRIGTAVLGERTQV
jgi:pyridoxal phosphate enzyme (YggS family)